MVPSSFYLPSLTFSLLHIIVFYIFIRVFPTEGAEGVAHGGGMDDAELTREEGVGVLVYKVLKADERLWGEGAAMKESVF